MADKVKEGRLDERDRKLIAQLHCLPSYGLLPHGDHMVSFDSIIAILTNFARQRGDRDDH